MSSSSQVCFNSECTEFKPERPKNGWRLQAGDFAELCDRCASAYEDGKFCETFHLKASGWRSCESCWKHIHCGCIVSANTFVLLDAGGIECTTCARKRVVLGSNYSRAPFFFQSPVKEKQKDFTIKNWNQLSGPGYVPCWQTPHLFSSSTLQMDAHNLFSHEVELPGTCVDGNHIRDRNSVTVMEKRRSDDFPERLMNGSLKQHARNMLENGNTGISSEGQANSCLTTSQLQYSLKEESSAQQFTFSMPYAIPNEISGQIGVSGSHLRQTVQSLPLKPFQSSLSNGGDSSTEIPARNGRAQIDSRSKNRVLPRYWPRFTDQDLQNLSMDPKSVITPLFEKMLSASDAGRIGRLVLPKKCAEAYLPPISQPEGLPLKVQDSTGKEWIFQFRFWPNNNSRMYVLEGVTTCIQSMQLQAGDTVTFSRLDPEGKLVMGFRKASAAPSDQDNDVVKNGNAIPANGDSELADPAILSKVDKSAYIAREVMGMKTSSRKRKGSTHISKSRHLKLENDDFIELKVTWEEAQGLLRPPPNNSPTIAVIEGFEFEEYEDAPILGKPAAFASDDMSSRLSCLAVQELTVEQSNDSVPPHYSDPAAPKRAKATKQETESVDSLEGLDTLANLAILGEGEGLSTSSQATTKHPRHRAGCSCIVCIQPPSGKGPKHTQDCSCNVCQMVRRRFRTLMMRRERKLIEKEEAPRRKHHQSDENVHQSNITVNSCFNQKRIGSEGSDEDLNRVKSTNSPYKGQIDLNSQPERDEDFSPGSDSSNLAKAVQDVMVKCVEQETKTTIICRSDYAIDKTQPDSVAPVETVGNNSMSEEANYRTALAVETPAPESAFEQSS